MLLELQTIFYTGIPGENERKIAFSKGARAVTQLLLIFQINKKRKILKKYNK